jgi:hypothetical protein
MALYLFRSGTEPRVFGFIADPSGPDLPTEFAPWTAHQDLSRLGRAETLLMACAPKRPGDPNQLARLIADIAAGEVLVREV